MISRPCIILVFAFLSSLCGAVGETLFSQLEPAETGIDHVHDWVTPEHDWTSINSYAPMAGVAMADYDSDGLLDIFLGDQQNGGNLYRNLGGFKFEKVTVKAGLKIEHSWSTGVSFADVNNDGHPDLFIGRYKQPNAFYMNNGDGTFRDVSATSGLSFSGATTMAAFADYDRDGDLDCYLLTNRIPATPGLKVDATTVDGKLRLPEEAREYKNIIYDKDGQYRVIDSGQRDYLFENDGKGVFTDVTRKVGLYGPTAPGLSLTWWDANNDLWPDLYVANDFYLSDHLWINQGGKSFSDQHRSRMPHQPWFSMGSDFADLNGDGHFDYLATDMAPSSHYRSKLTMGDMSVENWFLDSSDPPQYMANAVYLNGGNGQFMEAARLLNLSSTDWTWAVRASDLDCDGRQDLFYSTGMTRDFENSDLSIELDQLTRAVPKEQHEKRSAIGYNFWKDLPPLKQENFAFRNEGELEFRDATKDWGLGGRHVSSGVGIGDLDNDGDPDLIVMNFDEAPSVYRNNTTAKRLKVRLEGERSNRDGVGARLVLTRPDGTRDHRFVSLSRGYLSSSGPESLFGLGERSGQSSLRVLWPSGLEQTLSGLESNQTITVFEKDAGAASGDPVVAEVVPLFAPSSLLNRFEHRENTTHDEFVEEPLLPQRVSQLGPGLALGDFNGDGWDDFVLGESSGTSTLLAYLTKNGLGAIAKSQEALNAFQQHEDLAPLIFDADRDGDLDLLLTSGGSEVKDGDVLLRPRLFLNNGKGELSAALVDALPDLRFSAGPASVADYDRDGDLDLFIGGRINPGHYPTTPRSALLRNDSTPGKVKFIDVTGELAPDLLRPGMVTSALWSDATGDGWPDLLLAIDWGSVMLFVNDEGRGLRNRTASTGIGRHKGWFNSISGGDIDHDGDIDYVVGNFGRNTKYHPSSSAPVRIYYGDFDDSGKGQIVEAKVKGAGLLPVRGKSCSQNAMPFIRQKFPTYQSFAVQSLPDIYSEEKLSTAQLFEATTLDSALLINDGGGRFSFQPLPAIAQIAPVFGTTLTDLNGDSHLDMVLAQNFFGPQRETGRFDGGLGLVLLGDGEGGFEPLWPNASGVSVKADATALAVTDLNRDGRPDLVVATNNGPTYPFVNQSKTESFRTIHLRGLPGNPTGIGAKLTVHHSDDSIQTIEVTCGGGYLSQSSATQFLGQPTNTTITKIVIRLPNGSEQTVTPPEAGPINLSWQTP